MISPVSLHFEPPEPPGERDWPPYVRLTYGAYLHVYTSAPLTTEPPYPEEHLGRLIRLGYHVLGLLTEQTGRLSDEAVLAVAVLKDLEEERQVRPAGSEVATLLEEIQALLVARLRTLSLPTGAGLYSAADAAAVVARWAEEAETVYTETARLMQAYLEEVRGIMAMRSVTLVRRAHTVVEQSPSEVHQAAISQVQALLERLERGELKVTEVQMVERGRFQEITLKGWRDEATTPHVSPETVGPECI
ncbi:hypothetical protein [Deinococcus multiflagellatus]|uniref:Uncharacterized protein n=1 Tax=Deinococcus multiflagellatus TaxID=1656887 RepID=A0ABW1ZSK8_9DEIO|nr:hypothetical protein [Deinococcus multiflagellatus]MBZ9715618.1 hypothetical protein [Deinococcus multiflagellatus]